MSGQCFNLLGRDDYTVAVLMTTQWMFSLEELFLAGDNACAYARPATSNAACGNPHSFGASHGDGEPSERCLHI